MSHLKYIKLFESSGNVEVISIDSNKVTLVNPDGKEVTVEFEEDGQWSEWVDPPYVKEVSVSGEDGTYEYYMSAQTDEHGSYFEIDSENIDWDSLEDVRSQEEERKKKHTEHMARVERERREEEERINREVEERGITRLDYEIERIVKEYDSSKYLPEQPDPNSPYVLVESQSIDEDGFTLSHFWKILDENEDLESTFNTFSELGMEDALLTYFKQIPKRARDRIVRLISPDSNETIFDGIKLRDVKKYIDRFQYGVSLDRLFLLLDRYKDAI